MFFYNPENERKTHSRSNDNLDWLTRPEHGRPKVGSAVADTLTCKTKPLTRHRLSGALQICRVLRKLYKNHKISKFII